MVIVDANVLLYAVHTAAMHHEAARSWLDRPLVATDLVGLPWLSRIAFMRVATNQRAMPRPMTVDGAADQVTRRLARFTGVRHGRPA